MNAGMESWTPPHRIDVDEYYRRAQQGDLSPRAAVELIDGEIIPMAPIGSAHAAAVNALSRIFNLAAGDHALVSTQAPIRLDVFSEPQPDLALLVSRPDGYWRSHPTARDVLLIVEVSNTSLSYDRDTKLPLYARHAIPEVWILDLEKKGLHFFRSPANGRYADASSTANPGILTPLQQPQINLDLRCLLQH